MDREFLDTVKRLERHGIFSSQPETYGKAHLHYTHRDKPVGIDFVIEPGEESQLTGWSQDMKMQVGYRAEWRPVKTHSSEKYNSGGVNSGRSGTSQIILTGSTELTTHRIFIVHKSKNKNMPFHFTTKKSFSDAH